MSQIKRMSREQYNGILEQNYVPYELLDKDLPSWMKGMPKGLVHKTLISGSSNITQPYSSRVIPADELIGGMDIYRNAPDDPVDLNKDHYYLITVSGEPNTILVEGPIVECHEWLDEKEANFDTVEVWTVDNLNG